MDHKPMRDDVSAYLSGQPAPSTYIAASIHLGILHDMHIELTDAEVEHLFSLPNEIAIEHYCHTIIKQRL